MTAAALLNHAGSLTWYLPPHGFAVAAEAGMSIPLPLFESVLALVAACESMDADLCGNADTREHAGVVMVDGVRLRAVLAALATLNAKAAEVGK